MALEYSDLKIDTGKYLILASTEFAMDSINAVPYLCPYFGKESDQAAQKARMACGEPEGIPCEINKGQGVCHCADAREQGLRNWAC